MSKYLRSVSALNPDEANYDGDEGSDWTYEYETDESGDDGAWSENGGRIGYDNDADGDVSTNVVLNLAQMKQQKQEEELMVGEKLKDERKAKLEEINMERKLKKEKKFEESNKMEAKKSVVEECNQKKKIEEAKSSISKVDEKTIKVKKMDEEQQYIKTKEEAKQKQSAIKDGIKKLPEPPPKQKTSSIASVSDVRPKSPPKVPPKPRMNEVVGKKETKKDNVPKSNAAPPTMPAKNVVDLKQKTTLPEKSAPVEKLLWPKRSISPSKKPNISDKQGKETVAGSGTTTTTIPGKVPPEVPNKVAKSPGVKENEHVTAANANSHSAIKNVPPLKKQTSTPIAPSEKATGPAESVPSKNLIMKKNLRKTDSSPVKKQRSISPAKKTVPAMKDAENKPLKVDPLSSQQKSIAATPSGNGRQGKSASPIKKEQPETKTTAPKLPPKSPPFVPSWRRTAAAAAVDANAKHSDSGDVKVPEKISVSPIKKETAPKMALEPSKVQAAAKSTDVKKENKESPLNTIKDVPVSPGRIVQPASKKTDSATMKTALPSSPMELKKPAESKAQKKLAATKRRESASPAKKAEAENTKQLGSAMRRRESASPVKKTVRTVVEDDGKNEGDAPANSHSGEKRRSRLDDNVQRRQTVEQIKKETGNAIKEKPGRGKSVTIQEGKIEPEPKVEQKTEENEKEIGGTVEKIPKDTKKQLVRSRSMVVDPGGRRSHSQLNVTGSGFSNFSKAKSTSPFAFDRTRSMSPSKSVKERRKAFINPEAPPLIIDNVPRGNLLARILKNPPKPSSPPPKKQFKWELPTTSKATESTYWKQPPKPEPYKSSAPEYREKPLIHEPILLPEEKQAYEEEKVKELEKKVETVDKEKTGVKKTGVVDAKDIGMKEKLAKVKAKDIPLVGNKRKKEIEKNEQKSAPGDGKSVTAAKKKKAASSVKETKKGENEAEKKSKAMEKKEVSKEKKKEIDKKLDEKSDKNKDENEFNEAEKLKDDEMEKMELGEASEIEGEEDEADKELGEADDEVEEEENDKENEDMEIGEEEMEGDEEDDEPKRKIRKKRGKRKRKEKKVKEKKEKLPRKWVAPPKPPAESIEMPPEVRHLWEIAREEIRHGNRPAKMYARRQKANSIDMPFVLPWEHVPAFETQTGMGAFGTQRDPKIQVNQGHIELIQGSLKSETVLPLFEESERTIAAQKGLLTSFGAHRRNVEHVVDTHSYESDPKLSLSESVIPRQMLGSVQSHNLDPIWGNLRSQTTKLWLKDGSRGELKCAPDSNGIIGLQFQPLHPEYRAGTNIIDRRRNVIQMIQGNEMKPSRNSEGIMPKIFSTDNINVRSGADFGAFRPLKAESIGGYRMSFEEEVLCKLVIPYQTAPSLIPTTRQRRMIPHRTTSNLIMSQWNK